jgi:membrane protein YdbS with pleckstrin-like domain
MAADINLGLGEYLTLWVLIGVIAMGVLGWLFGVALGGALVFVVGGILAVLITYAILARAYRFLLHGSISSGEGGGGGGDTL